MCCSSHRFRVAQSQTDHRKPAAGCTMSGQSQQDQPVCRGPAQQDHQQADRGPVTPEVRKRNGCQELGNAIIEVLKANPVVLEETLNKNCVFRGDDRDLPVFEKIKDKRIPKLHWGPRYLLPSLSVLARGIHAKKLKGGFPIGPGPNNPLPAPPPLTSPSRLSHPCTPGFPAFAHLHSRIRPIPRQTRPSQPRPPDPRSVAR